MLSAAPNPVDDFASFGFFDNTVIPPFVTSDFVASDFVASDSDETDAGPTTTIPAIPFDDSFAPIPECPDLEADFCVPGDATHDGVVDFLDFLLLNDNYGQDNASWEQGDFDGDGVVGFADLLLLSASFADAA
jgi:hypothetical protein